MQDKQTGRILVIGDIHGCLSMLKKLMDKIDWQPKSDRLIFIGDYIDRGEDPRGVVEYLLSLLTQSNNIEFLSGNHEAMFMDYLNGRNRDFHLFNGGTTTLASYRAHIPKNSHSLVPEDHMTFYKKLKSYIALEDYYIVHAGFKPGIPAEKQSLDDMLWIRNKFVRSDYAFEKKIIFGHTPFDTPLIQKNKIGIDTGAVYGNKLTCLELPELRFYHVNA